MPLSWVLWEGEGLFKKTRVYWLRSQNTHDVAFPLAVHPADPESLGNVKILLSEVWSRGPDLQF